MASWQPPIPAGALYSKPARALGPALALLGYCYDLVDRDGWFTIALKSDATSDLDEPYPTIKRWWQLLETGPFFAEIQKHGRNGMRVRFKDVWLDWRILSARAKKPETFGTDTGSEMIPEAAEAPKRDTIGIINGTDTRSEMIPSTSGIKVLMTPDQAQRSRRASRAPPSPHQQLMQAYQETLGYKIPNTPKEAAAAKRILDAGYTPEQAIEVYCSLKVQNFYSQKHLSLHTVYEQLGAVLNGKAHRNGTAYRQPNRRSPQPGAERAVSRAADLDRDL